MDPVILPVQDARRGDRASSHNRWRRSGVPAPVFPPGRYGRRRAARRRRWWMPAVAALLAVLAGLAVAVRLHGLYGQGAYDAELVRYTDVSDSRVVVQFRVNLPTGQAAVCTVRARNRTGTEVGRAEVRVPPQQETRPLVKYVLATRERPVTGEIQGCSPSN